jgi:hypothetical protein
MDHVLAVLVVVAVLALFLLASPTRRCGCSGRCSRCKGTGRRLRLGARLVYRGSVKAQKQARGRWGK